MKDIARWECTRSLGGEIRFALRTALHGSALVFGSYSIEPRSWALGANLDQLMTVLDRRRDAIEQVATAQGYEVAAEHWNECAEGELPRTRRHGHGRKGIPIHAERLEGGKP